MGAVWSKRPVGGASKALPSELAKKMPSHCDKVAKRYAEAATELDQMAAAHREAAKAAQQ
jgi:ABC-type Zn uptake system ZnuABC Zn-binding protein ZnuA